MVDRWIEVVFRVDESTRRVYPTEETWETGSNARWTIRLSRTAIEWPRYGGMIELRGEAPAD